ncbi:MAG: hypothetical protein ACI9BD_000714, partial [Candidatus Marinamargulisbacteria bacterium]
MKNILIKLTFALCLISVPLYATTQPFIEVWGTAEEWVIPNRLFFSFSVESRSANIKTLQNGHKKKISHLIKIVEPKLTDQETLQTNNQSIVKEYDHRAKPRRFLGFVARTKIRLEVKDVEKYEYL